MKSCRRECDKGLFLRGRSVDPMPRRCWKSVNSIAFVAMISSIALACGQSAPSVNQAATAPASRTSPSGSSSAASGPAVMLDVTDKTIKGLQTSEFSAAKPWDLTYAYDCGASGTNADIGLVPKGGSMFHAGPLAGTWSSSGSVVLEGLAPGTYSFLVTISGCSWHIVAGIALNTDQLLTDVPSLTLNPSGPSRTEVDTRASAGQDFAVSDAAHSELIFAYDCGTQTSTGLTDPLFDLLYDNADSGHQVSGSLVRFFAPRAWGVLVNRSSPFASTAGLPPGYVAPTGTESEEVYQTSCRWHVVVGQNLHVQRPIT